MKLFLLLAVVVVVAADEECSMGSVDYLCSNVDKCWSFAGFDTFQDLKDICIMQGYTYNEDGVSDDTNAVKLVVPPRNLTVPEGATASFKCSADNAIKVVIQKTTDSTEDIPRSGNPTQQNVIQEIKEVLPEHEGWYTCTAYGVGGTVAAEEAYLEIRNVCENNDCAAPKECVADYFTGTYSCECPGDCPMTYDPVCGTDCESYFNECNLRQKSCELGLTNVKVHSRGLCSFSPSNPSFVDAPEDDKVLEGSKLKLTAEASVSAGSPEAEYSWFVDGVKVGSGNQFSSKMNADLAGSWEVKASICSDKYVAKRSFNIEMDEAVTDVTDPELYCCKVYGDPHILTFDQLAYDYMGTGSYVIAMDKNNGEWMVYGTLEKCGDKTKQLSCIVSITVFYQNSRVQFNRMWRVNNEGQDYSIRLGETREIGGIRIENRNMEYIITIGDTGVVAKWDGIITSQVCVEKCANSVYGLCGDADCDDSNEFNRMGVMNAYTNSYVASSSTEFGNSWSVDPSIGQPEDPSLAAQGSPCDTIPDSEKTAFEARCRQVADLGAFNAASLTTIDLDNALQNCYYDSCAGLIFGMGCEDRGDADCSAEIEASILAAMATGMTREEAVAMYSRKYLDPACIMGMNLARDLILWGVNVDSSWRSDVNPFCPSDEELLDMVACPML